MFHAIGQDVTEGGAPLVGAPNADTRAALATVDADADTIAAAAFSETRAIETSATGEVVTRYGGVDDQLSDAASRQPPELPNFEGNGSDVPPPPWNPGDPISVDDPWPRRGRRPKPGEPKDPGDDDGVTPVSSTGSSSAPPVTTSAPPTEPLSTSTSGSGAPIQSADTSTASSAAPAVTIEPPAPLSADQLPVTRGELAAALAALDLTISIVV